MRFITNFYHKLKNYVNDSSVNIRERTFIVFSMSVLVALFLAIPAGLVMREPLSATLSTLIGAVSFSVYVIWVFKKNRIARAKVVISLVLVFIFLPAMLFTNGGIEGGTPIWLLLGTIYIALILEGKLKLIMLLSEGLILTVCWIVAYIRPDLVTSYSRSGNYIDTMAALIIVGGIIYIMVSFHNNLFRREEEQKHVQRLFAQTATALVSAIDAKDQYTHGHSSRVAEYSRKIAEFAGKSPSECEEIYYVALLHDVGKIGIPEAIIGKDGRLTDEEYAVIKQHPVIGAQILQSITEYPYISIGARFHHERFDGKGYPESLKGTDIPEVARIISVADAYDAMTSKRSYRDPIPQEKVREELIEGAGSQFDPEFANIMLHLLDLDSEYEMKEHAELRDFAGKDALVIGEHRSDVSEGIVVTPNMTTIVLRVNSDNNISGLKPRPSLVLFDSIDGNYHSTARERKDLVFFEYAELWFSGQIEEAGVRKTSTRTISSGDASLLPGEYRIEAVKVKDHAFVRITDRDKVTETILALPDSTRYVYIGLTGEHCRMGHMTVQKSKEITEADYIPRIAEEISFINVPAGDVPNVQVDGYRSDSTAGIPVKDGMTISFHTKSLPTARLVWHCPSYVLFYSADGMVNGPGYTEYSLVRLDGENWEAEGRAENEQIVNRQEFHGWDAWKKFNKEGYDCTISFSRTGNKIVSTTVNGGISIRNISEAKAVKGEIYVALSGDQVALTNIRIKS